MQGEVTCAVCQRIPLNNTRLLATNVIFGLNVDLIMTIKISPSLCRSSRGLSTFEMLHLTDFSFWLHVLLTAFSVFGNLNEVVLRVLQVPRRGSHVERSIFHDHILRSVTGSSV